MNWLLKSLVCRLILETILNIGGVIGGLSANIWQIEIEVTQKSHHAAKAKDEALKIAKQKAFYQIIEHLSPRPLVKQDYEVMMQHKHQNLIKSFGVMMEKISDNRYWGRFTLTFFKHKLVQFCRQKLNLELITHALPPVMVVTLEQQNTDISLCHGVWYDFCNQHLKHKRLLQLQLAKVGKEFKIEHFVTQDESKLQILLNRFKEHNKNIVGILVVHTRFIEPYTRTMHGYLINDTGQISQIPIFRDKKLSQYKLWQAYIAYVHKWLLNNLKSTYTYECSTLFDNFTLHLQMNLQAQFKIEHIIKERLVLNYELQIIKNHGAEYAIKGSLAQITSMITVFEELGYGVKVINNNIFVWIL